MNTKTRCLYYNTTTSSHTRNLIFKIGDFLLLNWSITALSPPTVEDVEDWRIFSFIVCVKILDKFVPLPPIFKTDYTWGKKFPIFLRNSLIWRKYSRLLILWLKYRLC